MVFFRAFVTEWSAYVTAPSFIRSSMYGGVPETSSVTETRNLS